MPNFKELVTASFKIIPLFGLKSFEVNYFVDLTI